MLHLYRLKNLNTLSLELVVNFKTLFRNVSLVLLTTLPLLLGVVSSGCDASNSEKTPEEFHTDKLEVLWEIWEILQEEFVEREFLDPKRLTAGAISAMKMVADETDGATGFPAYDPPDTVPIDLIPIWDKWVSLMGPNKENNLRLNSDTLINHAIAGFLSELADPYTQYIPQSEFKVTHSNLEGEYQGIGAEIYLKGTDFILNPLPNSPAELAGIMPGDELIWVNGEQINGWTLIELVSKVRGPKGTNVNLGILRAGLEGPNEIGVTRGRIKMESVYWKLTDDQIAYIQLRAFYANSDETLSGVLNEIQERGATGLVLDLRNNPGGYLETVSRITSEFLSEGIVAYEKGPDGKETNWKIKGGGKALDIPMVILVNELSASASEVLTGALQDYGRAVIIGTRTYGKGSVNRLQKLSNGGGLYYTYARWYTPKGRLIEGKGLDPDVMVSQDGQIIGTPEDPQLNSGLDTLRRKIQASPELSLD
jgi:carboxyl-terminal processing protease